MNQSSSTANTLRLQCNGIIATSLEFLSMPLAMLLVHTITYSYFASKHQNFHSPRQPHTHPLIFVILVP